MTWSIAEVARLARVTSRTLRHYDATGLLAPAYVGSNGYRYYEQAELLRLQEILLLRELGLGLDSIAQVLAGETDRVAALRAHEASLRDHRDRLSRLADTVARTIAHLEGRTEMPTEQMFDGFGDHVYSGKVRELYETDDGNLLLVASDRISAFDHILETSIPEKGKILTALSLWWFDQLAALVPNHVLSTEVPAELAGRAVICRRLSMLPVECVARGYLTGSGLADYRQTGSICGVPLPTGLTDGSTLPEAIFTPATKAALGEHDENIDFAAAEKLVGAEDAARLRELTLAVYALGAEIARDRGVIIADTKLEFGRDSSGVLVLGDEVLTPDSSRFWPAETWRPGRAQPSYDKQYVRDWLTSPESGWDRSSDAPPPPLPVDVVEATRDRYVQAYERITGETWS